MKVVSTFFLNTYNLFLFVSALSSAIMLSWSYIFKKDFFLTIDDAVRFINKKNAVVVDVRSTQLFNAGHVFQAKHCSCEELSIKIKHFVKSKSQPVLVIASTGKEAKLARRILIDSGYVMDVFIISGGMVAWEAAFLPIKKKGGVS